MEPFTWSATEGGSRQLGTFGGQPALLCLASGPPERLPLQNQVGCLLVGPAVARTVDDRLMCGALLELEPQGDALLWLAHSSAATTAVTGFNWDGRRFVLTRPTYEACHGAPLVPVQDPRRCYSG